MSKCIAISLLASCFVLSIIHVQIASAFLLSTIKSSSLEPRTRKQVSRIRMSTDGSLSDPRVKEMPRYRPRPRIYEGKAFVTKDNIDTDQIIPAEYLTLVPSKVDEYEKLGSYALIGLPEALYPVRYVNPEESVMKTEYPIIIGGKNFGCGSSREHAPIALGASGTRVIIAESYARIFFRNSIATGELYPYEVNERLCDEINTGDDVSVDMDKDLLINHTSGKEYKLNPLGDAGPVIEAGGLFPYAVKTGMINK